MSAHGTTGIRIEKDCGEATVIKRGDIGYVALHTPRPCDDLVEEWERALSDCREIEVAVERYSDEFHRYLGGKGYDLFRASILVEKDVGDEEMPPGVIPYSDRFASEVSEIHKDAFGVALSESGINEFLHSVENGRMLVKIEDGEVVGYVFFFIKNDGAYITSVAVREDMRGRGLGRELIKGVEAVARTLHCTRCYGIIECAEFEKPLRFILSCGFRVVKMICGYRKVLRG
jgi:GNAT superfamily N-acetyltransferase